MDEAGKDSIELNRSGLSPRPVGSDGGTSPSELKPPGSLASRGECRYTGTADADTIAILVTWTFIVMRVIMRKLLFSLVFVTSNSPTPRDGQQVSRRSESRCDDRALDIPFYEPFAHSCRQTPCVGLALK